MIYVRFVPHLPRRVRILEAVLGDAYEDFVDRYGHVPDPGRWLGQAAALVDARLPDGHWYVHQDTLLVLASILAIRAHGFVLDVTVEDGVLAALNEARLLDEDHVVYYEGVPG